METIKTDSKPIQFSQPQLIAMLGLKNETFQAWRKRQGLFPWTNESRTWSRYSVAEVAATSVVVELTAMGMTAQKAVDIAMQMLPTLEVASNVDTLSNSENQRFIIVTNVASSSPTVLGFGRDQLLLDVFNEAKHPGPFIVIDVLRHVLSVVYHYFSTAEAETKMRSTIVEGV